ncbi:MAG: DUF192 domain-containing protein [Candidatus Omnitrophota bacterium]|nr:DUF192 domain-containing protein [Candidatus Omnitrophota bacterium]
MFRHRPLQLIDKVTKKIAVNRLFVADGFWSRFRGLILRPKIEADAALLLVPAASIHTFMMGYAIDVAMLSETGEVLKVVPNVRPWRIVKGAKGTRAVLEFAAGEAGFEAGAQLRLRTTGIPPHSLRFLWEAV